MNAIQISNVVIHQTSETLYSLNDLHQAAGSENKYRPTFWLQNQQTQDLIAAIEAQGGQAVQTVRGKQGGTYVCKELVIAYGMWINAEFALKVIRAFLAQQEAATAQPAKPSTVEDRKPLKAAVNALVAQSGINFSAAWKMVHQHFGIETVEELTPGQIPEAVRYVHCLTLDKVLHGEVPDRIEAAPPQVPATPEQGYFGRTEDGRYIHVTYSPFGQNLMLNMDGRINAVYQIEVCNGQITGTQQFARTGAVYAQNAYAN